MAKKRRKRLGIAFGGGGARGLAHIGVIRSLRKHGKLLPEMVAGTSAGSIAAAMFAADIPQERIENVVLGFDWFRHVISLSDTARQLFDRKLGGLVSNANLEAMVNRLLGGRSFEELPRDLVIVATDFRQRRRVLFTSDRVGKRLDLRELTEFLPEASSRGQKPGCSTLIVTDCRDVGLAVRASCAVPGVFLPVAVGDLELLDGGVLDQVPVDVVRAMGAELTIGVSLAMAYYPQSGGSHVHQMFTGMINLLAVHQIRKSLDMADIGFQIPGIDRRSLIDARQYDLIDSGERCMDEWIACLEEK